MDCGSHFLKNGVNRTWCILNFKGAARKDTMGTHSPTLVLVTTVNASQCQVSGIQSRWIYSIRHKQRFLKHKHLARGSRSPATLLHCTQNSFFQMCLQWIRHQPTHNACIKKNPEVCSFQVFLHCFLNWWCCVHIFICKYSIKSYRTWHKGAQPDFPLVHV